MLSINKKLTEDMLKDMDFDINPNFGKTRIKDVYYKKLKTFVDKRGDLTELWSYPWTKKEPIATVIKHVYYNTTHQGVVKGWHYHKHTFSQYTCVKGKMQVCLLDIRWKSETYKYVDKYIIGNENPSYIKIPPGVLKAWKSLKGDSIIVNLLTSADVDDNYKFDWDIVLKDIWEN